MATIEVEGSELVVALTWLEKLAAMRGNVRVPMAAVRSVAVEDRPWRALRGFRAPGTGVPSLLAYGARRHFGGTPAWDFAALRGQRPSVRVECGPDAPFARLLISTHDPWATAAAPQAAIAGL
ncbi:MAG: hypothetical protein NVSMB51_21980 [Solirubrobacteraceae bacterium]